MPLQSTSFPSLSVGHSRGTVDKPSVGVGAVRLTPNPYAKTNTSSSNTTGPAKKNPASSSNPSSAGTTTILQAHSIQATLASLQKEVEEFRRAARQEEAKHAQLQRQLSQHWRPQQHALRRAIQEARDQAGAAQQQHRSVAQEGDCWQAQLKAEGEQLKALAQREAQGAQQEARDKRTVVQQRKAWNRELHSMLKAQDEEARLQQLGNVVQGLDLANDKAAGQEEQQALLDLMQTHLCQDKEDDEAARQEVAAAVGEWLESSRYVEQAWHETQGLEHQVQELRAHVLKQQAQQQPTGDALTEAALLELESQWEQTTTDQTDDDDDAPMAEADAVTGAAKNPVHMQLFYETTTSAATSPTAFGDD